MKPEMEHLYSSFFSIMLLSMLIWGEARSEPEAGKFAVAWVVRNRVYAARSYGKGWDRVMLRKKQFSCFNEADLNREKVEEIVFNPKTWKVFRECFRIAFTVYYGVGIDYSGGATHYFRVDLSPEWARKMIKTAVYNDHVFYKYEDE